MGSGDLIENLHLDDNDTGIQGRHLDMDRQDVVEVSDATVVAPNAPTIAHIHHGQGIRQHKDKVVKVDACLLNDKVVFPWLRTSHLY